MAFPTRWMDELLSKNELVGLVSQYVQLKPKGGRMWGCCPFHNEKTPSFSVSADKQLYYCFGCHAGGNAIQFVMDMERLGYGEAVRFLAERVGMEMPEEVDDERLRRARAERERIFAANREAALFYARQLRGEAGAMGREYLAKRGLNKKTLSAFGLGFAPADWDSLCLHLMGKGFTQDELISAGLAGKSKRQEGCYDFFRNRVIFPIQDASGRVLGFGGRTMTGETPKYINTGDTPVFNKRRNLYALNRMKGKKLGDMVMCEGYMDVISLHQWGVDNAVATLGTALTPEQARLIRQHYTDKLYLCYDGDAAGINAALRGIDILAKEGIQVKIITIPNGMDPDDYVKANGQEGFLELKTAAKTAAEFRITQMAARQDMESGDGREAFAREACAYLARLEPVERERYIPLVARSSGLPQEAVKAQCGIRPREEGDGNIRRISRYTRTKKGEKSEVGDPLLIACALSSPEAAQDICAKLLSFDLPYEDPVEGELIEGIIAVYAVAGEEKPDFKRLLYGKEGPLIERFAAAELRAESLIDPLRTAMDCIKERKLRQLKVRMEALTEESANCVPEELREKTEELMRLQSEYTKLK